MDAQRTRCWFTDYLKALAVETLRREVLLRPWPGQDVYTALEVTWAKPWHG